MQTNNYFKLLLLINKSSILLPVILLVLTCSTPAAASDSNKVEASFRTFCQKHLVSLRNSKNRIVQCAKRKDVFIAEYSLCSKDYSITVKEGNPKDSSYVGILKYKQEKFKSSGNTREIAKNGTFQRTGGGVPVTELFLYRNGRWQ